MADFDLHLDNRLSVIASFISRGSIPLDIGTDHGKLPAYLILNGICSKVIASDISAASLKKAERLIKKYDLEGKMVTRLGDSFAAIQEGEADTVIMAGTGGNLMIQMMEQERDRWKEFKSFIFQPMFAQPELRCYLVQNGLQITDEEIAYDNGRYYEVMHIRHGYQKPLDDLESMIGPVLLHKPGKYRYGYLLKKMNVIKKAIDGLLGSTNPELQSKIQKYQNLFDSIKELMTCLADAKN